MLYLLCERSLSGLQGIEVARAASGVEPSSYGELETPATASTNSFEFKLPLAAVEGGVFDDEIGKLLEFQELRQGGQALTLTSPV